MIIPLLALDVIFARLTLRGLRPALLLMHNPSIDLENLLAVLACTRLHIAALFMICKLDGRSCERAVLALNRLMSGLFVILTLRFGDNFTTLTALVVITSASDLMHTHLGNPDGLLAGGADFSFFHSGSVYH